MSFRSNIADFSLISRIQSILNCSETNEGFYIKCGFKRAGLEMVHYYTSGSE